MHQQSLTDSRQLFCCSPRGRRCGGLFSPEVPKAELFGEHLHARRDITNTKKEKKRLVSKGSKRHDSSLLTRESHTTRSTKNRRAQQYPS